MDFHDNDVLASTRRPTLADAETWRDIRSLVPDAATLGERGMAFERPGQLALEHLYGVR